jgi:hypothetical protein
VQLPAPFAPALELKKSPAGPPAASSNESAPQVAPQDASLPIAQFDLNNFFYTSHASLGCDSELLN